jgi:glycosyltransferase involved in cell wall biosynthesis
LPALHNGLHVLYLIDSLAPGGAERSLAALAPAYADLGIRLDVATLTDRGGLASDIRAAGAGVHFVRGTNRLRRARAFAELVQEISPDLVHTTLFESDLVGRVGARFIRTPVVSSLVTEGYGPQHAAEAGIRSSRLRAAQCVDALTARCAIRMHAVSERVADVMAPRLRYPRARIDVVPRGRDPRVLGSRTPARRAAARARLRAPADAFVILAVARQEPPKSLDTLLDAFARVAATGCDSRVYVAGREGTATRALRAQVERLGLAPSVTFLGERSDVADLLCAADVFVLPSRREGMPGSVIEALALETPVVATNLPQVREVTGDDAAILVPVGDPAKLAAAMQACRTQPAASARRVHNGLRRFRERFTITATAEAMLAFYRRSLLDAR